MAEPIFNPSMAAFLQRSLSPQRQRALSLAAAMRDGSLNPGAAGNGESVMGPMPQMPPTLSGVENMGVEQRVHHSNYQPRDAGRFVAGAPEWPELPQEGPPRLRTEPGPPPTSAQNMALEMTGLPSAMRGSQSLARARQTGDPMDVVRGVGQVAAAGPGRGGLAGFLLSEAAAQTPDPRQKRIKEIDELRYGRARGSSRTTPTSNSRPGRAERTQRRSSKTPSRRCRMNARGCRIGSTTPLKLRSTASSPMCVARRGATRRRRPPIPCAVRQCRRGRSRQCLSCLPRLVLRCGSSIAAGRNPPWTARRLLSTGPTTTRCRWQREIRPAERRRRRSGSRRGRCGPTASDVAGQADGRWSIWCRHRHRHDGADDCGLHLQLPGP